MKKFYRITDHEMEVLATYMDSDIREEVHFRFAPCTNEEFIGHVFIRKGITKEIIEGLLNVNFEEIERTYKVIDVIKGYMFSNNIINYAKKTYPDRRLWEEQSEKGREYRRYLELFCQYLEVLKSETGEVNVLLSVLKGNFPEIGFTVESGYFFYTWKGEII